MIMETINNMLIELYVTMAQAEVDKKEKKQSKRFEVVRAQGKWGKYDRLRIQLPDNFNEVGRWKAGEITAVKAMELTELKKTTFYK